MTSDIRLEAWNLGRTNTAAECYTRLERGDEIAVRVFAAIERNEFGVKAAWLDGLRGVNIEIGSGVERTSLVGHRHPMPVARSGRVAANGGSV